MIGVKLIAMNWFNFYLYGCELAKFLMETQSFDPANELVCHKEVFWVRRFS